MKLSKEEAKLTLKLVNTCLRMYEDKEAFEGVSYTTISSLEDLREKLLRGVK